MKGIILAGGTGSRLFPMTKAVSKHLLPIYDKPMIYYPLSVLMLAGIKDICIITTLQDLKLYKKLLANGEDFGIDISYFIQKKPNGIAEAFILVEDFIADEPVCLILGDNIFYGQGFTSVLQKATNLNSGALVFGYSVKDPERFGVIEFNENMKVLSIEEKPEKPKSSYAATGLYFYDASVVEKAKSLKPSARGELEITDINKLYLVEGKLNVQLLGRGFTWLDTGTFSSLLEAGQFVETIEERQGLKIACLEEISFNNGWIKKEQVLQSAYKNNKNSYGEYLFRLVGESNDSF